MFKYLTTLLFWGLALHQLWAQPGIRFATGTFQEARAQAAREGKLIFVYASVDWCRGCLWMPEDTFPDSTLGSFFNQHYVSLQIDMEKGEGLDFRREHSINQYPSLLWMDSTGKVLHREVGAQSPVPLLKTGQNIKRLFLPDLQAYMSHDAFSFISLDEAFEQATTASKLVFVYLTYGTPLDSLDGLDKATFCNPKVMDLLKQSCVSVKLNNNGIYQLERLDTLEIPFAKESLLFFHADGRLLENHFHQLDTGAFLGLLERVRTGATPTLVSQRVRFEAGERDLDFLASYALAAFEAGFLATDVIPFLRPRLRGRELLVPQNWRIFTTYRLACGPESYDDVVPLLPELEAYYGRDSLYAELFRWKEDAMWDYGNTEDPATYTPHIVRLEKIATLYPRLKADVAFLKKARGHLPKQNDQPESIQ
jgi:hypothetical protein